MEWDVYGGYNGKVNDDLGYNVGLIGWSILAVKQIQVAAKKWDTTEFQLVERSRTLM